MDPIEHAEQEALTLLRLGGHDVLPEEAQWLSSEIHSLSPDRADELAQAALRGFFHAVAEGHLFVPHSEIEQRYGQAVHDNYPEGGVEFLDLARNYWTLRILVDSLTSASTLASSLLTRVERIVGPLFFPTPGPARVSTDRRENDQRALIAWSGARIDVDELMRGNAILIRERRMKSGGCLGSIVLLASCLFAGGLLLAAA